MNRTAKKSFWQAFWDFFVLFSGISTASNLTRTQRRPVLNRGLFLFRSRADRERPDGGSGPSQPENRPQGGDAERLAGDNDPSLSRQSNASVGSSVPGIAPMVREKRKINAIVTYRTVLLTAGEPDGAVACHAGEEPEAIANCSHRMEQTIPAHSHFV